MAKIGSELRYRLVVRGLVNTEGGRLRFATGYPPECTECEVSEERLGPFFYCNTCGRSPRSGGRVVSGDGDGIYPVIEVTDNKSDSGAPIAVLVVFDSNYELANQFNADAQRSITPTISQSQFSSFLTLPAIDVVTLEPTETLVLGGGSRHEPAIDCSIQQSNELIVRTYVETPGSYSGNFATFNAEGNTTVHIPRVLAVGTPDALAKILGEPTSTIAIDWAAEELATALSIVTSHVQVVADSLCAANAQIADSYLKNMNRFEHSIRNWEDEFFSWVILGAELGDEWCSETLKSTFGVPAHDRQLDLLSRRVFNDRSTSPGSSVDAATDESATASNFCSNCGQKFATEVAKFCPACGSKRV